MTAIEILLLIAFIVETALVCGFVALYAYVSWKLKMFKREIDGKPRIIVRENDY